MMVRSMSNRASSRCTRLERNRIDHTRAFATAPLPGCALDVGQLEEFAPGMCETVGLQHRTGLPAEGVELVVAAIGVGLQYPRPGRDMRAWMFAAPVAGIVEQRGGRIGTREWSVVVNIHPEPGDIGLAPGHHGDGRIVAM